MTTDTDTSFTIILPFTAILIKQAKLNSCFIMKKQESSLFTLLKKSMEITQVFKGF
ncbi:hypothetical protein [Peribacillus deserti]|uniref:hypothetical protein n=1 Tax=Peribacillus deserti TaxID=673318 RepID=UPI0015E107C4|nr:hypothetical protein [Peribacillus deserti]